MNGRNSAQLLCTIFLYIERMACRVECIRSEAKLQQNVLQLFHNLIFELQALVGMECFRWSKHTKYPFDTRAFKVVCSFLSGSATSAANRVKWSIIVSTCEHFISVGGTDSVLC